MSIFSPTEQDKDRGSDKVYFRVTALLIKPDIIFYFRFTSTFAVNSVLCMRTTVSLISLNVSTSFFVFIMQRIGVKLVNNMVAAMRFGMAVAFYFLKMWTVKIRRWNHCTSTTENRHRQPVFLLFLAEYDI